MKKESVNLAARVLPLVLAGGELDFSFPLQAELGGKTEDFDEPTLTVQAVKATALSGELFVEMTVRQESYYVQAQTGLVEKATLFHQLSQLFAVPEIRPGNRVEIQAEVMAQGNWRVMASERHDMPASILTGECRLKLTYAVYDQQRLIIDATGDEEAVMSEVMEVESFLGQCLHTIDIALPVELGYVPENIGNMWGGLFNAKASSLPGWVRLEGDVTVAVPYVTAGGDQHRETFVLPLLRYLEFPGAKPGMTVGVEGRVELFTCRRAPKEASGVVRGLLHTVISLYETEALAVPVARSHSHHGHHNPFLLEEVIAAGSSQTLIQREIVFTRPARKVREPVDATVRNLTHEIIANKVIVRGVLHKQLFAVDAATGAVFARDVDESFVHFVDVPGAMPGMRAHVRARVEFVSLEIRPGGETARQVTIIEITVKVTRFIKKNIVLPLPPLPVPTPHPPLHPGGRIYIVRPGDSVWKIARMFGVSMESIIAANNLQNPNLIFPGQKLVIPG